MTHLIYLVIGIVLGAMLSLFSKSVQLFFNEVKKEIERRRYQDHLDDVSDDANDTHLMELIGEDEFDYYELH